MGRTDRLFMKNLNKNQSMHWLELENFIASIDGEEEQIVTGEEGLEALKLAMLIQESIEQNLS